jgi:hypothetical protein
MKYDLESVEWIDSAGYGRQFWHSLDDHDHSIVYINSVGYVVHETDLIITLIMNISTSGNVIGDMTIPKCAITKRKILKKKDAER